MKQFNTDLRMVVASMYDQGRVVSVSHLQGGCPVPPEARPILVDLVTLTMLTEFTKADTKEYLASRHRGIRTFTRTPGCSANRNTSRSRVQYDLSKLKSELGLDFFNIVFQGGDLTRQAEAVTRLMKKARGHSLLERFIIPLPSPTGEAPELTDQSREKLIQLTKCFSSARVTYWSHRFTVEMVNYITYLENHQSELSDSDQETFDTLRRLLTK